MPEDATNASLHRDIKIFSGILLQKQHFEEANWLWMALGSPASCDSAAALSHLRRTTTLAREHKFWSVAKWIESQVLRL